MNENQLKAINTTEGPVITIAGPGSGKTSVIVGRLKRMTDLGIAPESILVVTFSRAAADSMKSRYLTASKKLSTNINFGTFHSTFFNILKKYANYNNEDIVSQSMCHRIILSCLKGKDNILTSNPEYISEVLSEIAFVKGQGADINEYESKNIPTKLFRELYKGYHDAMREFNKLDFEDMLTKTYALLKSDAHALATLQSSYKYILVDEFQDINPLQYKIIRMLAKPENNLFVVGDDDQAIYSFRGASPSIMRAMTKDFKDVTTVYLNTNYRCPETVLDLATRVIRNNTNRFDKNLIAYKTGGEKVDIKAFKTDNEEKDYIAEKITNSLKRDTKPNEIAILVRTRADIASYASMLLKKNLPFSHNSAYDSVFENRYVQPVLNYLKFAAGENTRALLLSFINKPVRYIKREALTRETVDLDEVINYITAHAQDYALDNAKSLKKDISLIATLSPEAAVHYIRKVVGYDAYLCGDGGLRGKLYDEAIDRLNEFEAEASHHKSFKAFFSYIEEYADRLRSREEASECAINLMTYHGAKGLEFKEVYMPNCIEGVTPHKRNTSPSELEEERRMFYVAMTRTSERLTITHSLTTQGREGREASRFLGEMELPLTDATKGTRVMHKVYKSGTIIQKSGDNLTVKFDNIAVPKVLNYNYCMSKGLLQVIE